MNRCLAALRPVAFLLALAAGATFAQGTPPAADGPAAAAPAPVPASPLAEFAWLAGCWSGTVNQREFREHWMPLRGNLMLGTGHNVADGRTQDYEYIRLEPRADGVHYIASPSGQKEAAFRFVGREMDGPDAIYAFANPAHDFPQRISYRRGSEGWLYVHVEGKLKGEERRIIYPMRRVDCESGEFIRQ